jgi:outer membrane receptor protein involved in Fe transport
MANKSVKSLLTACVLACGGVVTLSAQSVANGNTPVVRAATLVNVDVVNAPLVQVLEDITRQARLRMVLSDNTLDPARRVSLRLRRVRADEAIAHALAGTGIRAAFSSGFVIFSRTPDGAAAHAGIVTGTVTDRATAKPLPAATITIAQLRRGVSTDSRGAFQIGGIPAGTCEVSIRLLGYSKTTRSVTVRDGETVTLDVTMERGVSVLDQVIVTGTVIPTERKAIPNAITVITAKQLEERGVTRIDQLFRGDVPGLFSLNVGSSARLDQVVMYSRGATALTSTSAGTVTGDGDFYHTNPIKTYVDGVELANPQYLSQIDPRSIERIEILTGPQASTIYGSNAINGVMQIFTKRGSTRRPQFTLDFMSGVVQNNFSDRFAPDHRAAARVTGIEGRWAYNAGTSWDYAGSWTPSKQTQRVAADGGARFDLGVLTFDASARQGWTNNKQMGRTAQGTTEVRTNGTYAPNSSQQLPIPERQALQSRTVSMSAGYRPFSSWSHEVTVGSDMSTTESVRSLAGYGSPDDSTRSMTSGTSVRTSQRYSTALRIPVFSFGMLNLTAGADHWRSPSSSWTIATPLALTGTFGAGVTRNKAAKNSGAFVQGQFAVADALFVTYGVRADWNPTFGDDARVVPGRYGLAYTRDVGALSVKLRGSYGRSIRPPADGLKLPIHNGNVSLENQFGVFDYQLANPHLLPEDQRGGEGGVELYLGSRASLVVTRYNQTVDNLISNVAIFDSVRSLTPVFPSTTSCARSNAGITYDADGHCFWYLSQFVNLGSIRNQGWELQGSVTTGPFTTRGTYSWVKSRVIGVTRFSSQLGFTKGRPFDYVPEHTWALGTTYIRPATTVSLSLNGTGQRYLAQDYLWLRMVNGRISDTRPRFNPPTGYRALGTGYMIADVNAAHRLSPKIDMTLQVNNLADYYQNDLSALYASPGRQMRGGLRIRL